MADDDDFVTLEEFEGSTAVEERTTDILKKPVAVQEEVVESTDLTDLDSFQMADAPQTLFDIGVPQERLDEFKKMPPIGFWEGAARNGDDAIPFVPIGGFKTYSLWTAVNRLEKGKYEGDINTKLDDIEEVNDFLLKMEEERIRGFTTRGKIGAGLVQAPAFLIEFMATGGLATLGKKAVAKTARKIAGEVAEKGLKKFTRKVVAKTLTTGAGAFGRTIGMPHRVGQGFLERRLQGRIVLTEKGLRMGEASIESPYKTMLKAFGEVFIGNFVEDPEGLVGVGFRTVGSTIAKRLPKGLMDTLQAVHAKLRKLPGGEKLTSLNSKVGYNSFIEELGEEKIEAILRLSLGIEDTRPGESKMDAIIRNLSDGEQLLVEMGVIAGTGAGLRSTSAAVEFINQQKKEAGIVEKESRKLTDTELNNILEEEGVTPTKVLPAEPELPLQTEEEILDILAGKKPPPAGVPLEIFAAAVKDRKARAEAKAKIEVEEVKPPKEKIKLTAEEQVAVQEAKAKFPEKEVIIEGRAKRLAEDLTTLQKEGRLLQKTALEATEDVDSQIDGIRDKIDVLQEQRTKLVDEFQSSEKVDAQIKTLETEIGVFQKQKTKILQKLRSDEKALQERVDTARKKFDTFLKEPKAEAVKPKAAIVTTPKALLSVLTQRVKQAQQFAKGEAKIVQSQLIQTLEKARIPTKPFLRTIKNIQTLEQLKKQLPEFERRITKAQETSARRKLRSRITKKLKRTKPRKVAGKPRGRLTADVQRTLDLMREASQLGPIEAELKIQNSLLKFKGVPPSAEKALELSILSEFSDLGDKSVEQLEAIDLRVSQLIAAGREGAKTQLEKKKDKKAKELEEALNALPEIVPTATEKERRIERVKGAFASFGKSITGWPDIMDVVFGKVMDSVSVVRIEQKEKGDVRRLMQTVELAGMKAFGFTKVKQLLKQFQEDTKKVDLGVLEDASGKEIRLLITKSEARKVWMELFDPLIVESVQVAEGGYLLGSVEINGFTEAMIGKISEFLTTEDKLFVDAQLKIYRDFYSKINTQFRKDFGVDLPFNPSYSPIKRVLTQQDTLETFFEEMGYRRSISPTFLKTRVKNFQKIRVQSDMQVLQKHVAEMTHYLTWSEKMKQLEGLLGNNRLRSRIEEKYGKTTLSIIDGFVNDFRARDTRNAASVNGVLDYLRTNFTVAALAFKPAIMVKQWTSFVAYAEDIPVKDFIAGIADFARHPLQAKKTLEDASDLLQTRGSNITRDIRDALKSSEFGLFTQDSSFKNLMLWFTKAGDKGAILLGGWAVYRHTLKTTGSKQKAIEAFEDKTQLTQQSGDQSQQSQWQRAGSFAKLFTMFSSAQNQYLRRELAAIRQISRKQITMQQFAKKIFIYHVLLPNLFQWASNFFEWDEDEQIRATTLGSLNGLFLLGDILDSSLRLVQNFTTDSDLPVFTPRSTPLDDLYKGFERAVRRISKKSVSTEDVLEAIEDLLGKTVGPALGVPIKRIYDSYEGAEDLLSGEIQKGVLKLGGWSPWLVEKQLGKKKNPFD